MSALTTTATTPPTIRALTWTASLLADGGRDFDALIDSHPQGSRIRRVLAIAYKAFSWKHKYGLDAACFLMGPAAGLGFSMVRDHREEQARQCLRAVEELLTHLGDGVQDRRIVALLLNDYPGRDYLVADRLRRYLSRPRG